MSPNASRFTISVLVGAAMCSAARSQCPTFSSPAAPQATLSGFATCSTVWDPDGVGPAPQLLVVGGEGLVGGPVTVGQRTMTWDGTQWQPLGAGPGTTGNVTALTTWNGMLVAAGTFTGGGMDRVALWNGSAWQPLGPGLAVTPAAITEWNGTLVAAAHSLGSCLITAWNGAAWSTLPTPPTLQHPRAIVSFQGLLCVGGRGPAGTSFGALERWNGTTWLPTIPANATIQALAVRAFQFITTLYVGGEFQSIGPGATQAIGIASTSGGTTFAWNAVGSGLGSACLGLHVRSTSALGTAVVARLASPAQPVVQLSGSSFVSMGNTRLSSVSFFGGSYHATTADGGAATVRRYDGSTWAPVLGPGINGEVRALTPSGADVIVGGTIQSTTGAPLNGIARWTGTAFQPLGSGMQGGTSVDALCTLANGDIVAGGLFADAGGASANNIARWNGSAWSPLGTGCDQQVFALCKLPNGDVVAGGRFATAGGVPCARIARWNGTVWSPFAAGMNNDVRALAVRGDGTLFAGGLFTAAGGVPCNGIAQWNGTAWLPVGSGVDASVHALVIRPNNDVVAGGPFLTAGGTSAPMCARWTGSTWSAMGTPPAAAPTLRALLALPNGDVVAARNFLLGPTGISRWDGAAWSTIGATGVGPVVNALAQRPDGAVIAGGVFDASTFAPILLRIDSTCMPLAQPYGAGCSGAAGPLVLTAEALPWLDTTFRTIATGVAPFSLCLAATGFSQVSLPLSSILAQGQPGCSLLASPDILAVLLASGTGTATSTLALANDPSLLGATFFQQVLPLEFSGPGALAAVRASNALAVTIGTL